MVFLPMTRAVYESSPRPVDQDPLQAALVETVGRLPQFCQLYPTVLNWGDHRYDSGLGSCHHISWTLSSSPAHSTHPCVTPRVSYVVWPCTSTSIILLAVPCLGTVRFILHVRLHENLLEDFSLKKEAGVRFEPGTFPL